MRFVPVKTREQQALLSLHRVRQGFVEERTALINRLRGLLAQFGLVFAQRHGGLRAIPSAVEGLPALAKRAVDDLLDHLRQFNEQVNGNLDERDHLAIMPQPVMLLFLQHRPPDGIFADHSLKND